MLSRSINLAWLAHNQIAFSILDRSLGDIDARYRSPPGAAPDMCAASPIETTAIADSSLGPLVSCEQPEKEQRWPARNATMRFVFSGKSSRLVIIGCTAFLARTSAPE